MAKTKQGNKELGSYSIKDSDKKLKVGDSVLIKTSKNANKSEAALVEKIVEGFNGEVNVNIRWYYYPEDTVQKRRSFHGAKELFLSNHSDTQSVNTIEDIITVHTLDNYSKLQSVELDDYYCRFEYDITTKLFTPETVDLYCMCEMPANPDDELMIGCDTCDNWFHPVCLKMTNEEAKELGTYTCCDCSEDEKSPHNGKAENKRQKR